MKYCGDCQIWLKGDYCHQCGKKGIEAPTESVKKQQTTSNKSTRKSAGKYMIISGIVFLIFGSFVSYVTGYNSAKEKWYNIGGQEGYNQGYDEGYTKGQSAKTVNSKVTSKQKSSSKNKKSTGAPRSKQSEAEEIPYTATLLEHGWYASFTRYNNEKILPTQDDWLLLVFSIENHAKKELSSIEWSCVMVDTEGREFDITDNYQARSAAEEVSKTKYPNIESDPDINPTTKRTAFALFDVPKNIDPVSLRIKIGMLFTKNIDLPIPAE
jgi:hypothetical protein